MKLTETIKYMESVDFRDRFKAEYYQLKIRRDALVKMLDNWDKGNLGFKPTCPRSTYNLQLKSMNDYLAVLEARAVMEKIKLS